MYFYRECAIIQSFNKLRALLSKNDNSYEVIFVWRGLFAVREKIKLFVESKVFTTIIFILIVLNTISLGVETFVLPDNVMHMLNIFNYVCIAIFILEIVLKLIAYGWNFFKDGWNLFDTFIVIVSVLPMITFFSSVRTFRIFRMFRALRALRVMKRLEKLRIIVQALLSALPSVAWVVLLLLLIYYIFAVIGTNLFAELSPDYFGTLWRSAYTLFQITLADDLGNISRPLLSGGIGPVIYFVSFVALSTILVLNVIVGVVVDSVAEIKKSSQRKENKLDAPTDAETNDDADADLLQEIQSLENRFTVFQGFLFAENKTLT